MMKRYRPYIEAGRVALKGKDGDYKGKKWFKISRLIHEDESMAQGVVETEWQKVIEIM